MDKDIFTSRNTNTFINKQAKESNFFLQPENIVSKSIKPEAPRHLNDYDFNILKEDAYKDVEDEIFKLEYKINKLESSITDINNQIQAANDIRDYILVNNLVARKKQMLSDLEALNEIYNDTSLSAKISGGMAEKLKNKFSDAKKVLESFSDSILSKLPGKFSYIVEIKNSLSKLENINKSVDELISMQAPYADTTDKYNQLSKYIIKANNIQAEISRVLKK